jgi:hypothetical protein
MFNVITLKSARKGSRKQQINKHQTTQQKNKQASCNAVTLKKLMLTDLPKSKGIMLSKV